MPLFYLRLRSHCHQMGDDGEPEEFEDLYAARSQAIASLQQAAAESRSAGKPAPDEAIEIADGVGSVLHTVMMSEAMESLKNGGR